MTSQTSWLSLIETFQVAAELTGDRSFTHASDDEPYFGLADVFISYFWQAEFVHLVDAIAQRDTGSNTKYWMDIFTVAQLRHTPQATEYNKSDAGKFDAAIKASNAKVWIHCEPWDNPRTLKRVWCAYLCLLSLPIMHLRFLLILI